MPRLRNQDALDRAFNDIVSRAAAEIAQTVRQNIADEVSRLVGSSGRTVASRVLRKRKAILCPICGKPGGGPRWKWACADHKNLSTARLKKARQAARN